jgi:hypothetical protein
MPLKVETEDRGPITVIRLSGNLAMGRDSQQVENTVTDLLQRGRINLVLDLLEWMVSTLPASGWCRSLSAR